MIRTALLIFAWTGLIAHADDTGRFPFDPKPDDFKPDAVLDLRSLNEKVAGETGFVKSDGKGGFTLGNGEPLRFWAVGSFVKEHRPWTARPLWPAEKTEPSLARHARFLAKHGVNLARMHCALNPDTKKKPDARLEDLNPDTRDYIWEFVAAMKQEGIYSMLTPYWANAFKPTESMGYGTDNAHALLFFDPRLRAAYKGWLHELLTKPNPHTGIALAKDPGLAVIQIQNEDSTLFWTMSHLKGPLLEQMAEQFSAWLLKQHGSAAAVMTAWDNAGAKGDDVAAGRFELLNIYELTTELAKGGRARRLADQLHFWSEMMFDFHREIADFLRNDCGCRQLISAGNWHTANTVLLNDALRWSYTATDVQSVNRYFPGVHEGDDVAGWTVRPGQIYNSRSFLTNPQDWPLMLKLPKNQPFIITESSWTFPSLTASEGPFLIAAYQPLTGLDAFCWFAFGHEQWAPPMSGNGYMKDTQEKFIGAYPDCLGQFPAAALIVRKGYVKQGQPVIEEARPLDDLWQRRKPVVAESAAYDSRKETAGAYAPRQGADPAGFFVGPVEVEYGADASKTKVIDLKPYVDHEENVIRSNTGEHTLDLGKAAFRLDTPCAQGVAAFFKNQRQHVMSALTVESENDYGVCIAVSLDGKPLGESGNVLIQCGTNSLPAGWQQSPAPGDAAPKGKRVLGSKGGESLLKIDSAGHAPWMMEKVRMTITLKNTIVKEAVVLDANGYARQTMPVHTGDGLVRITLPADAIHVVLR